MKYIAVAVLVILLVGCGWNAEAPIDDVALVVTQWVHQTIEYEATDEWNTPQQTLDSGKGDCANMVVLAMDMLHDLGIYSVMGVGYHNGAPHGWLACNGEWYEVTGGFRIDDRSLYELVYYVGRFQAMMYEIVL